MKTGQQIEQRINELKRYLEVDKDFIAGDEVDAVTAEINVLNWTLQNDYLVDMAFDEHFDSTKEDTFSATSQKLAAQYALNDNPGATIISVKQV